MSKDDDLAPDAAGSATLREPAAPRVPLTSPPAAVSVIPLPGEERACATEPPQTLQEAREATDALLRDILEGEPEAEPPVPGSRRRGSSAPRSEEEDWPVELHPLHHHDA